MKQHSKAWRRVVVPAAFLAATVFGVAGPALADSGHGHASGHAHRAQPDQTGSAQGSGHAAKATSKSGDGATTFSKPNSWQAQADPDGMTNGGVDQPGGTGGTIGSQDGNNGSGNDVDCEDDNRGVGVPGHCKAKAHSGGSFHAASRHEQSKPAQEGSRPAHEAAQPVPGSRVPGHHEQVQGMPSPVAQSRPAAAPAVQILGISAVRPRTHAVRAEVAGISAAAPAAPAALMPNAQTLPNTGAPALTVPLAGAGLLLLGGGGLMLRRRSGKAVS